jgi:hypothetical protein
MQPLSPKPKVIFRTLLFYDTISVTRVVNLLVKNYKMDVGDQRGVSWSL